MRTAFFAFLVFVAAATAALGSSVSWAAEDARVEAVSLELGSSAKACELAGGSRLVGLERVELQLSYLAEPSLAGGSGDLRSASVTCLGPAACACADLAVGDRVDAAGMVDGALYVQSVETSR
jgi:hypothetical protein